MFVFDTVAEGQAIFQAIAQGGEEFGAEELGGRAAGGEGESGDGLNADEGVTLGGGGMADGRGEDIDAGEFAAGGGVDGELEGDALLEEVGGELFDADLGARVAVVAEHEDGAEAAGFGFGEEFEGFGDAIEGTGDLEVHAVGAFFDGEANGFRAGGEIELFVNGDAVGEYGDAVAGDECFDEEVGGAGEEATAAAVFDEDDEVGGQTGVDGDDLAGEALAAEEEVGGAGIGDGFLDDTVAKLDGYARERFVFRAVLPKQQGRDQSQRQGPHVLYCYSGGGR